MIARGNVRRAEKKKAEAYLTFEECQDTLDTDRDQVEVGRQVDTDGQGTYYLNGEEVRLKDVQDLFRDTGIGQDLYSSIGQGEVLNLIESKPEDRREIIEEAAGIASYRHRRDLTKRRLDRTRTELEQVEKDLREKKGRLSQLQGQAEKAEEVRELQSELRSERLRLARRDYVTVHEKLENLDDKLEENKERLQQLIENKSDITDRKSQLQSLQQSVESKLNRLKSLAEPVRRRRQERREKRSEFRTRLDSLRERMRELNTSFERIATEPRALVRALFYSYVGWVFFALPLYFAALALETPISLLLVFFIVPASTLAGLVPSPGGLGGVEAALLVLLVAVAGLSQPTAFGAALLYRVESYAFALVAGGVGALWVLGRN